LALLHEQIEGKYEILQKLKEGGMGAIYKVRHRLLDEVRIIKVIRSHADPAGEAGERFLREARSAIRLRHPNIATLHDFAIAEDGQAFIVMELIDGWTLLELLQGYGPPPLSLTLEIARQSLKALGYLHRHKIVHRDVSPDNLMLTRDVDGHPQVKLIDLGIAKALEGEVEGLTTTGIFLAKPRYGSPERFGDRGFDERSDLYSFAVVFYELLTGRCPIRGNDPASFMAGHLFRPPLEFAETDPQGLVPEDIRRLVLRTLEKRPEDRPANAEEMLRAIDPIQARFPLSGREIESVFGVLRPVAAREADDIAASTDAVDTQDRLNQEFGLAKTPLPAAWGRGEPTRLDRLADQKTVEIRPDDVRTAPELARVLAHPTAAKPSAEKPAEAPALPDPTLPMLVHQPPPARPSEETTRSPSPSSSVLDDLTLIRNEPPRGFERPRPEAVPAGPAPAAAKPAGRRGLVIGGVLILLPVLVAGGWWGLRTSSTAESAAETTAARPALPEPLPASIPASTEAAVSGSPAAATAPPPAQPQPKASAAPVAPKPEKAPSTPAVEEAPAEDAPFQRGDLIRPGPGVEVPVPFDIPPYSYPAAARGTGKKASIRVALLVDEEGQVIEAQVREGDKSGLGFNEAALETARKVRFQPPSKGDVPGKMWTELILDFSEPATQ
jgi:serine/threonine-protein kinase